jgi:hypothetical protein
VAWGSASALLKQGMPTPFPNPQPPTQPFPSSYFCHVPLWLARHMRVQNFEMNFAFFKSQIRKIASVIDRGGSFFTLIAEK